MRFGGCGGCGGCVSVNFLYKAIDHSLVVGTPATPATPAGKTAHGPRKVPMCKGRRLAPFGCPGDSTRRLTARESPRAIARPPLSRSMGTV